LNPAQQQGPSLVATLKQRFVQEIIYKLDNWTIIKLLGGSAFIVTAIIWFFYKIILSRIGQAGQHSYDKRLEDLKGEISKNNTLLNSVVQNYFSSSQKLLDKKIKAYDLLWSSILNIKDNFPSGISAVYQLLIDSDIEKVDAYKNLNENTTLGPVLRNYTMEKEMQSFIDNGKILLPHKPYLSDESYKLYYTYQGLTGRVTHQFIWEYSKSKLYNWKKDEHLKSVLKITLTDKEIDYIKSLQLGAFTTLIDLLEYKILQDIRSNLNIKHSAEDTIEYLKDIEQILGKTKK
jgi:hypothetical protein